MFTDVGFPLNSGFTKILCTPIFPLLIQAATHPFCSMFWPMNKALYITDKMIGPGVNSCYLHFFARFYKSNIIYHIGDSSGWVQWRSHYYLKKGPSSESAPWEIFTYCSASTQATKLCQACDKKKIVPTIKTQTWFIYTEYRWMDRQAAGTEIWWRVDRNNLLQERNKPIFSLYVIDV